MFYHITVFRFISVSLFPRRLKVFTVLFSAQGADAVARLVARG